MSERREGKVVPLGARPKKDSDDAWYRGVGIALPISPPGQVQADRMLGYFPNSLKEYYRRALMEYKTIHGVGNQKLRDLIMEPEDAALRLKSPEKTKDDPGIIRDPALSLDDLKKWFANTASHQLGDMKFAYVNRFVQKALIEGGLKGFQVRFNAERTHYHRQALRDIFASGYLTEEVAQILDGTESHVLISALTAGFGAPFPTCLVLCGGFYAGIAPVTLVFSDVPALRENGKLLEEYFIALEKGRFPVVLRGYAVISAAMDYYGGLPGRELVNAKLVLTNEDVHAAGNHFIPYSRIMADSSVDVIRNETGAVTRYSMTIDTTEFPQEVSYKAELKKISRFGGADVQGKARQITAVLEPNNSHLDRIVKKFSAGYP